MKTLLIGLVALPFITSNPSAANRLNDAQLDLVTAGAILGVECPVCIFSSSNSMSANGVTTTTSSTQTVSGGNSNSDSVGRAGPSVVTTVAVPATLGGVLEAATFRTVVTP